MNTIHDLSAYVVQVEWPQDAQQVQDAADQAQQAHDQFEQQFIVSQEQFVSNYYGLPREYRLIPGGLHAPAQYQQQPHQNFPLLVQVKGTFTPLPTPDVPLILPPAATCSEPPPARKNDDVLIQALSMNADALREERAHLFQELIETDGDLHLGLQNLDRITEQLGRAEAFVIAVQHASDEGLPTVGHACLPTAVPQADRDVQKLIEAMATFAPPALEGTNSGWAQQFSLVQLAVPGPMAG